MSPFVAPNYLYLYIQQCVHFLAPTIISGVFLSYR